MITDKDKAKIDTLTQVEAARIFRFTPAGGWPFNNTDTSTYFCERFKQLGGMTVEISKQIGWGRE